MRIIVVAAVVLIQSTSFAAEYCRHQISKKQFECAVRTSVTNPFKEHQKRISDEYKKPVTETLKGVRTATSKMKDVVRYRSPLPIMIVPDKTAYPWRPDGEIR